MGPLSSPEAGPRLTLVGTVHRHSATLTALQRHLELLRPTVLTLEMSPFAVHWRLAEGPRQLRRLGRILDRLAARPGGDRTLLETHPAVEGIRALLEFPAEFRAAAHYAGRYGIPLYLIDDSRLSALRLRRVERELVTCRNLQTLLSLPPASASGEGGGTAVRLVEGNPGPELRQAFLAGRRRRAGIGWRDLRMARQIMRLLPAEGHLVHIGGWVHLLEDERGQTLFSRLRHLTPQRVLAVERFKKSG